MKKIEFCPTRRGFLGVLTRDEEEGRIHVLENHLAETDQSGSCPRGKLAHFVL